MIEKRLIDLIQSIAQIQSVMNEVHTKTPGSEEEFTAAMLALEETKEAVKSGDIETMKTLITKLQGQ